ncbi:MAG: putative Ig domain-containing protein, partial [Planctomycetota bacterium]
MTKPGGTIQPGGNFFVATHQALGKTTRTFEVINSYGVSATTTHDLIGIPPGSNDFDRDSLVDLSTITDSYGITSFDARQDTLYADLQITNTGDIPITAPFLVGLRNLSDASVSLLGIDGYWDDGTPYIDFSDQLESSDLLPGDSTVFDPIAFDVPERSPFTYDLVLLGGLNREPRFTSVPVTNARGGSGQTYSAPVTGVDPDGHAVEFELVTSPVGMTIQDLGGGYATLSWSNIPAEQATYPVTLRVSDSLGASSTQTFVIRTIDASVNRPPVFVTTPIIDAYAESDYEYNANARDIDGDPIAYTLSAFRLDDPSQTELAGLAGSDAPIQFDPSTASITWSPAGEDAGVVHFVLTADDGRGGIDTQVFDVLVHPVADNYPPRFTSVPATRIAAGDVFVYQATAVDPDLDPTTFQPVSLPAGASLTPNGMLQFATAPNTTASHEFTIDVRDGRGHIVTQSFTVDAIDESPATLSGRVYYDVDADGVFNGSDQGVPEILVFIDSNANFRHDLGETSALSDSSGNYTLSLSPPGAFRIAFDRGSQWSTLGPQGLVHTGVATAGQTIADLDIRLAARAPANNAPEIVSTPPQTARYLETYTYDVNATDLDGDSLFYELLAVPSGVTLDPVTGLLTWIPGLSSNGGKSGTDQLSVRVTDGNGGSDTQTWWPDIVFENAAPHFVSVADPIATVDLPYQYAALAIDPDGDRLTYSLDPASLSRGMVIDADS